MLLELGIVACGAAMGGMATLGTWSDNQRFPRPMYGAFVSWWYGRFVGKSAAMTTVMMLDSDHTAQSWTEASAFGYKSDAKERWLWNESLGLQVHMPKIGHVEVKLRDKKVGWITVPVSAYEDYHLAKAVKRWKERKADYLVAKEQTDTLHLLDHRINQLYIKMIEDIEKKILKSTPETAPELQALLSPPEPQSPNGLKIDHSIKKKQSTQSGSRR